MNVLHYDRNTGEFISLTLANESPEEPGVFAKPAFSVFEAEVPLPALLVNEAAVWNITGWVVVPDFRADKSWYLIVDGSTVFFKLGESPDETMSQTFPAAIQLEIDEALRVSEIEAEAVLRMQTHVPTVKTIEEVNLIIELWAAINPASRNPTSIISQVIDIAQKAKTAISTGTPSDLVVWP